MITAIFLKLIANEMIVTRILSAVLSTLILYSLYIKIDLFNFRLPVATDTNNLSSLYD